MIGDTEFQAALSGLYSTDLATIRKAREARDTARINELAEAIENLAIAVNATRVSKSRDPMVTEYLTNSREWMRGAIRAFMTPNLNLVNGQARQVCAEIPPENRVRCARCGNTMICRDMLCADWAAALKKHIGVEEPPVLPPDGDLPRAA